MPVITLILSLLVMEAVLALCGMKPVLYQADPYAGFASNIPLFEQMRGSDSNDYMVTTENKLHWFNDQRFVRHKVKGSYRIFCLGGSTTYGRPYNDMFSFSGWLREFLTVADPTPHWEVINAGLLSYGSYRVAMVMEELITYEPDLFIVYTGHNEFLERRTYKEIIAAPES